MKISLINGSPKAKNSCSDYLLKEIKKLLAENKAPWKRWERSIPNLEYKNRMTKGE